MNEEDISIDQVKPHWFIDLDWYQQNSRSFSDIARVHLCPECREHLKEDVSDNEILTNIKDCCSKTSGFITGELPVLESIFRLFLANGNQSLDLEELEKQLSEWRGGDAYRTSAEILARLLKDERYYGIRQVIS